MISKYGWLTHSNFSSKIKRGGIKMRIINLILLFSVFILNVNSYAQTKKFPYSRKGDFSVAALLGATWPMGDLAKLHDGTGLSIGIEASYGFSKSDLISIEYLHDGFYIGQLASDMGYQKFAIPHFGLKFYHYLLPESIVSPFLIGSMGSYNLKYYDTRSGFNVDDLSERIMGLSFGAGIMRFGDYFTTNSILEVILRFHFVFTKGEATNFITINIGYRI